MEVAAFEGISSQRKTLFVTSVDFFTAKDTARVITAQRQPHHTSKESRRRRRRRKFGREEEDARIEDFLYLIGGH